MWKTIQSETSSLSPNPASSRPEPDAAGIEPAARTAPAAGGEAFLGKGLIFKGEIAGSEPLFIEGRVEGSINLEGSRVTLGPGAQVTANITARDVVVQGRVLGDVTASNRVEIRATGALTGDVTAAHLSIEDGAFLKGGFQIRGTEAKPADAVHSAAIAMEQHERPREVQAGKPVMEAWPQSA